LRLAQAALILGVGFAAVSVYWGLGGTWLLDTVGGPLEKQARAGTTGAYVAAWAAAALKLTAAVLPLLAVRGLTRAAWHRTVWVLAWLAGGILTIYGLLQTTIAVLALAGVLAPGSFTPTVQAWHAFFWDPWFLIWGILAAGALLRGRNRSGSA